MFVHKIIESTTQEWFKITEAEAEQFAQHLIERVGAHNLVVTAPASPE